MKNENYHLFDSVEFEEWATASGLHADERIVFEKYFSHLPRGARILDVGTGGGRIAFALHRFGFRRVAGIDMSPRLIEAALSKSREIGAQNTVEFSVQSACDLSFADNSQDGLTALQQLISLIEDPVDRVRAIDEFYRVLAPGGILFASFMSWEGRWYNPWVAAAIVPFKLLKGEIHRLKRNYLCWLKLGRKPNLAYLFSRQPYTYWFGKNEIEELVSRAGFRILEVASAKMLIEGRSPFEFGGMINVVAQKPMEEKTRKL